METGQPYAYTADDPLNSTDPLGLKGGPGPGVVNLLHRNCSNPRSKTCSAAKKKVNRMEHPKGSFTSFLKAFAVAATFVATVPLDETGAGEVIDAGVESATSARSGVMLGRQLASEGQTAESGSAFAGSGTSTALRDAPRLAQQYGGAPEDWMKMTSSRYTGADGFSFETHWYQNDVLGQALEHKTNFQWLP
jgi:hypothetical protein